MSLGMKFFSQDRCRNSPIKEFPLLDTYYLATEQALSVQVGDVVAEGHPIIQDNGRDLLIHSPVTGIIKDIQKNGNLYHIVIQSNKEIKSKKYELTNPFQTSVALLLERLRLNGVIGTTKHAKPVHDSIQKAQSKIHTIVINGIDCEPFVCSYRALLKEKAKEIIQAAQLLKMILGAKNILIAITKNRMLKDILEQFIFDDTIDIFESAGVYPEGYDKLLLYYITGHELNIDQNIFETGYFIENADTFYAIYEALFFNKPLTEKVVTIDGAYCSDYGNFIVKIGTPISAFMRPFAEEDSYIIFANGPLHGIKLEKEPNICKWINSIFISEELINPVEQECIFCIDCVTYCPVRLQPYDLVDMIKNNEYDSAENYGIHECLECNLCSYVCPSFIPLGKYISDYKKKLKSNHDESF